jgi:hypothetical protein
VTRRLAALALAGLAALLLGLWGAWGAPRLTLSNAGIGIDYPAVRTVALFAAAAVAAGLAFVLPRRVTGVAALVVVTGFSILGLHRLAYRLLVGPAGLSVRDLRGSRRLAWRDVTKADPEAHVLLLEGRGGERVSIETSGFTAQQRATLERAVARHVREAQAPAPSP